MDEWRKEGIKGGEKVRIQVSRLGFGGVGGWVCPAAICRNGPRLRKP